MLVDSTEVASTGMLNEGGPRRVDMPPHLDAFLAAKGIVRKGHFFDHNFRFLERVLVPGDMVQVVGPAHREGDDTSMRAGLGLAGELILARGTLDKLARRLRRDFVIGATLAILGVASLAIGWLRGLFIVH